MIASRRAALLAAKPSVRINTARSRLAAAALACFALVGVAAAPATGPQVQVDTKTAQVGQLVHVTGSGWAPVGGVVQIELCGQDAVNFSDDCDQSDVYQAAIRPGGAFYGALRAAIPPAPCPCVVAVAGQDSLPGVKVPIVISGARYVPVPAEQAPGSLVALSAKLLTPVSVSSWFGGPKVVTLILEVTNHSQFDYQAPTLSVSVGRGRNPTGFVVGKPLGVLAAGSTQLLRIPVTVPAFTAGDYSVRAEVLTSDGKAVTVVGTSSYPWALFVLAALLVQGLLILMRNRLRSRLLRRAEQQAAAIPVAEAEPTADAVPVIDLRTPEAHDAEPPLEIDLRSGGFPREGARVTTHRLALSLPGTELTWAVEVAAHADPGALRTTVRAWDRYAGSPWDALHEHETLASLAAPARDTLLLPGMEFRYSAGGIELDMQLLADGPELDLGRRRTVQPVRVRGTATCDGRHDFELVTTLERTWEPSEWHGPDVDEEENDCTLSYGHTATGETFYLLYRPGREPSGWLVRHGVPCPVVHATEGVIGGPGPYPQRVLIEMTDGLGRRLSARGLTTNGMTCRSGPALVMACRTEWVMGEEPAVGEHRATVSVSSWRSQLSSAGGDEADR